MTYTHDLAFALRLQDASEDLIVDVIREVESLRLPDEALEEELGSPYDYAERLVPDSGKKKRMGPIMRTFLGLAVLWLVLDFTARFWGWNAKEELSPMTSILPFMLVGVGIFGQFLADYLKPIPRDQGGSLPG